MTRSVRAVPLSLLLAVAACGDAGSGPGGGATSLSTASGPKRDFIVLVKDPYQDIATTKRGARAQEFRAAHGPIVETLKAGRVSRAAAQQRPASAYTNMAVTSFTTIHAFAVKGLDDDDLALLQADSRVAAVVPDAVIRAPRRLGEGAAVGGGATAGGATASGLDEGLCNTLEPEALQLMHAAFLDPSAPQQAQEIVDGTGQKVTGRGVTVATIADGFDPTVPGLVRPDGTSVVIDYQDFSGDPAGTPTGGGEMFGDVGSIAAQDMPGGKPLLYDISQYVNPAHPLPSPCNIRVRGMAPGASVVALKVFSSLGYTTTSSFVQAIEWAAVHDQVDVINESFGGNPVFDDALDPTSLANRAAVRAGVTVTVSTGDAGSAGTLGSPATDPFVIAAAASTQFRAYQQTRDGLTPVANGYVSDNISALSSGGFAQAATRTADVLAPGDLGWSLCSTNTALFQDCTSYANQPSLLQVFGGTSESAPLTAGAAALVIQAYRSTHGGASPSPGLVKSILMSSADDIGAPATEQGAGLLNAYKAVNTALSIRDASGRPAPRDEGAVVQPSAASVTARVNQRVSSAFTVTNTGKTALRLTPALQKFAAPFATQTVSLNLDPAHDPTYINVVGATRVYIKHTFKVPSGTDRLEAAVSFIPQQGGHAKVVAFALLDPSGKQVAYSIPQGAGSGYGHVDVVKPVAGDWTVAIRTSPMGVAASYSGPVQFTWAAERYVAAGRVSPDRLTLAPGERATLIAELNALSGPGDLDAAIRFVDRKGNPQLGQIPFGVRVLIPLGPTGGAFSGTLTGGNGRGGVSPTQTFAFDVPQDVHDLSLDLQVADSGYSFVGYLVDPNGLLINSEGNLDPAGNPQTALQLFRQKPQSGRWRFVLTEPQASGRQTSIAFSARIDFNKVAITAPGLPTSPSTGLSAGHGAVTVPVTVRNTGAVAKAYFADARLAAATNVDLGTGACSVTLTLPGLCRFTVVPPFATDVVFRAQSATARIQMDATFAAGGPDLFARPISRGTVAAEINAPEVPYGTWFVIPALVGPFGPAGAPTVAVTTDAVASMNPFDAAVSATTGNYWADLLLHTTTYAPLILAPGASGTITLTITPDAKAVGKTVRGFVAIETQNVNDANASGDEVIRLPYAYTIKP